MFGKKKPGDPSADWTKTGSFMHKPSRGWLHSDDSLMEGGVCYAVTYVGCLQVLKSMRTLQYDLRQQVTREAILRCSEASGYHTGKRKKTKAVIPGERCIKYTPALAQDSQKLTKAFGSSGCSVNMTISSLGIKLSSIESGRVIVNHDMQGISFASGGEKDCIDMVGYVAKDPTYGRACHVIDCGGGLAYDVINTIGQAFEIRFKMFLQNPPLATEVPERFSETIFDDGDDHVYEAEPDYDEPGNNPNKSSGGYEAPLNAGPVGYMALQGAKENGTFGYESLSKLASVHGYDVPKGTLSGYDVPKIHPERSLLDDYDNPTGLPEMGGTHFSSSNGVSSQTNSLVFAAGALYENPVSGDGNMAFYENPLATSAPKPLSREDSLEGNQLDLTDLTLYDNPLTSGSLEPVRTGWATFDDDSPPPPPPPMATNPAHQDYNSPKEPTKMAPPKPKPYAQSRSEKEQQALSAATTAADAQVYATVKEDKTASSIEAEDWYHGNLSRAEAELLLEDEGDFLVRESKSKAGQYVLSGVQNRQPRHLLLVDPEGKVRTKDREFSSVVELVEYHTKNKLPIISSGSEVTISHPVLRQ